MGFQGSFLQQLLHPAPSHPPARSAEAIEHLERMDLRRLSMHKDRAKPANGMLMGQELLWAPAAAASPPEDPFAFTIIKVLRLQLSAPLQTTANKGDHFLQLTRLPTRHKLTTTKHFSCLIEKSSPGAHPPGTHTLHYLQDKRAQVCCNEGERLCIQPH